LIRPFTQDDAEQVLQLNAACMPEVGTLDSQKLDGFAEWAPYLRVVEVDSRVVGFLVGLTEQAPYTSPNFAWFKERYPSFAYVDRVAVDEAQRGTGWGPALYRDFEAWATEQQRPMICAEVNTEPPNPRSLRFHDLFGFDLVDQFQPYGPDLKVGMMVKKI